MTELRFPVLDPTGPVVDEPPPEEPAGIPEDAVLPVGRWPLPTG